MPTRDVIVIGASAGGIEALSQLMMRLPGDLPAALFVVVHFPATSSSVLPKILSHSGRLPAVHAEDGQMFEPGHIYVAPPNQHLLLTPEGIQLSLGPHQHGFRPAIDALFHSAARAYGERVAGVLLSGGMSDGVSGLGLIRELGGVTLAQDPQEALVPILPENAIAQGVVDYVLPVARLARQLQRLAGQPEHPEPKEVQPAMSEATDEDKAVRRDMSSFANGGKLEASTLLTCPECGGVMWELRQGQVVQLRCHVGHVYSLDSFLSEQSEALEAALWAAVRTLEERAALYRRIAHMPDQPQSRVAQRYLKAADECEQNANLLRRLVQGDAGAAVPPGSEHRPEQRTPGLAGSSGAGAEAA